MNCVIYGEEKMLMEQKLAALKNNIVFMRKI